MKRTSLFNGTRDARGHKGYEGDRRKVGRSSSQEQEQSSQPRPPPPSPSILFHRPPFTPCEVYTPADARTTSSPWKLWRKPNSKCTFAHHLEPIYELAAATVKSRPWSNVLAKWIKTKKDAGPYMIVDKEKKTFFLMKTIHVRLRYHIVKKLRKEKWLITLCREIAPYESTNIEDC